MDANHKEVVVESPANEDGRELKSGRLRQLVAYGRKVFGLSGLLSAIRDSRRNPIFPTWLIMSAVFFAGLLRVRSLNALEPLLKERPFRRLLGAESGRAIGSVDTVSRTLSRADIETVAELNRGIIARAERNKVFREGWHGALRFAAIDGWEAHHSDKRHCEHCLVRRVKKRGPDGNTSHVEQYYHAFVVAMLVDDHHDLVLDFEQQLPADLRRDSVRHAHEGELTAVKRLLPRLKQHFGWVDVLIADALYANGPFLTLATALGFSTVIVAKKETDEPLREAIHLWANHPPQQVIADSRNHERIELWNMPEIETLDTYKGKIRVARARITKKKAVEGSSTWTVLTTGKASRLAPEQAIAAARRRWHIENTAFRQWTHLSHLGHIFTHHAVAIPAFLWLFIAGFNLLTLFLSRQVKGYGRFRGSLGTRTILRFIDELWADLARFDLVQNTS